MVGGGALKRHPSLDERFDAAVRIVAYDPAWAVRAQQELHRLERALGPVAIRLEHVGSTSVPGLAAKSVLDLQLSVAHVEPRARYTGALARLGYVFIADPQSPDFHFFAKQLGRPRSHHLHVCQAGSEHESRHLAVRDFLRANGEEAAKYASLKRDVAQSNPQDRLAYIAGKASYVSELELRAIAWAEHRSDAGRALGS